MTTTLSNVGLLPIPLPATSPEEHLEAGYIRIAQADEAYDMAETVHDRALAWRWRKQAEQLTEDANRHFTLAH